VADFSTVHEESDRRIKFLLDQVGTELTRLEREEVVHFIEAREFGLALETLAGILTEEGKMISRSVLGRIDDIARLMQLRDGAFMFELHNYFDRQHTQTA